jgi:hypothetical protein
VKKYIFLPFSSLGVVVFLLCGFFSCVCGAREEKEESDVASQADVVR